MSPREFEPAKLSKKEERRFYKELQVKTQQREKRKLNLIKGGIGIFVIVAVIALGYWLVTAKPTGQNGSSSGLSAVGNLKLGDTAPGFTLPSTVGETVSLREYKDKNVLLYFQEGVMCQPCWKQIGTMQKNSDKFKAIETEVVAIGVDTAADWGPILKAEGVTSIPILIDNERKVSKEYGVLDLPSQMHSDRPGHTFVLINKEGKIAWIADYPTMRVSEEEILSSVEKSLGEI